MSGEREGESVGEKERLGMVCPKVDTTDVSAMRGGGGKKRTERHRL